MYDEPGRLTKGHVSPTNMSLVQELEEAYLNNLQIQIGLRQLDDSDWDPIDEQPAFGVGYTHSPEEWLFELEAGIIFSGDDDDVFIPGFGNVDVEAWTTELSIGGRKTFGNEVVRPYVGAGLSIFLVDAELDLGPFTASDDDVVFGLYTHAGIGFQLNDRYSLGFDLRWLLADDADIGGEDVETSSFLFTLVFGIGF